MESIVRELMGLTERRRVARIGYRRVGQATETEFVVEPRRLHRTPAGLTLHARQLSPPPEVGRDGWRDFRVDRITSVTDDGGTISQFSTGAGAGAGDGGAPPAAAPAADAKIKGPPVAAPAAEGRFDVFDGWGEQQIASMGPAEDYFRHVESAMFDGKVTPDELSLAEALRDRVESHERKAVHARVYANVLHEVIQDSRISHREEQYLQNVKAFLDRLGWAP